MYDFDDKKKYNEMIKLHQTVMTPPFISGLCAHDRHALPKQLALNVHVKTELN